MARKKKPALAQRKSRLRGELLEARRVLDARLVINEFMALNTSTIADEDSQFVPWIELRNIGDAPQSLSGWHLTNSAADLDRWTLPNITLPAGQHLMVFASGKNRNQVGSPLHTNFSLASQNGYLALVRPDGTSVEHVFASYQVQVPNVSFGVGTIEATDTLVTENANLKYRVPAGPAELPANWNTAVYSDAGWSSGQLGIGFDNEPAPPEYTSVVLADGPLHYYRFEETTTASPAKDEIGGGVSGSRPGTYTGGITLGQPSASSFLGSSARFNGASGTYVNLGVPYHPGDSITVEAWVKLDEGVTKAFNAIVARWDGSYELDVNRDQGAGNFVTRSTGNAFGQAATGTFTYGQWHHIVGTFSAGVSTIYLDGVQGSSSITGAALQNSGTTLFIGATRDGTASGFNWTGLIDEVAIYNRPLTPAEVAEHYTAGSGGANQINFDPLISSDIGAIMQGINATAAIRIPFTANDPAGLEDMKLRMKYDDGFVAYINGVEVARRNAPLNTPAWNATATAEHANDQAILFEEIDISAHIGSLLAGPSANVLAIHALNVAAADTDLLIVPELIATDENRLDPTGPGQYFNTPTPGTLNTASSPGVRTVDNVRITEFLAQNDGTFIDEDGDASDWIELYNANPYAVDLNNAYLTNDGLDLTGWRFGERSVIPAGGYLVVFASGKDRKRDELHTSFKLGGEGEYLALVKPDGLTIVSAYTPTYPSQLPNVSYGTTALVSTTTLIPAGANARVRVPLQAADMPAGWNTAGFNDAAWLLGPAGVGYDSDGGGSYSAAVMAHSPIHYWRLDGSSTAQPTPDTGTIGGNSGTFFGGVTLGASSAGPLLGTAATFDGLDAAPNGSRIDVGTFHAGDAITVEAWVMLDPAANRPLNTVVSRWDGSFSLDVNGSTKRGSFVIRNSANQLGSATTATALTPGVWHHLVGVYANGTVTAYLDGVPGTSTSRPGVLRNVGPTPDRVLIGAARTGSVPNSQNWLGGIDEVAVYAGGLTTAQIQQHFVAATQTNLDLSTQIATSIAGQMQNQSSTALVRSSFNIAGSPSVYDELKLRIKYDDGFVAYINGQEVARRNAPGAVGQPLVYNSIATATHPDPQAIQFEEIDISQHRGVLTSGNNVLAIAGLNVAAGDVDFLVLPELIAVDTGSYAATSQFFLTPTPGSLNGIGALDRGAILSQVQHSPSVPTDAQDMVVTARATATSNAVSGVNLHYRVMFGGETTLAMRDDGLAGDATAGDGIYTGIIPASAAGPGEMVRYRVTATDAVGSPSRWPLFPDPAGSEQYQGTVIADPAVASPLPILQWFVQNTAAADNPDGSGTRASIFYDGEFYDNVFVRTRGATAPTYPKKPYKIDFNKGHYFRYSEDVPRVEEINVNSTYQDKTLVRAPLSMETYQEAGVPAPDAFNIRVERNGEFFSVAVMVEQVDENFLERRGLDPEGAMYKFVSFNGITSATLNAEKKTQRDLPPADLQQVVTGLALSNPNRDEFVLDNFDIPAVVNYLATGIVFQDFDRTIKNYYLYRNPVDNEWQVFPWDKDLTFGLQGLVSDNVQGNNDNPTNGYIGHPLFGTDTRNCCGVNNLFDAVYDTPLLREMVLRRLRTMMDEFLQAPGTPAAERHFETRLDELYPTLQADAALDLAKWGPGFGASQSLATAMNVLKSNFLDQRRTHLYQTHSVDMLPINPNAAGIPHAQAGAPPINFGAIEVNPESRDQDEEYIELVNPNSTAVDISGWTLSGGVTFTFAPGTVVPANGHLYVSPDVKEFRERISGPSGGQGLLVVGGFAGHISNLGETIELRSDSNSLVATITTPSEPSDLQNYLRITEVMYHPAGPSAAEEAAGHTDQEDFEFVELKNIGPITLDLSSVEFADGIQFEFAGSDVTSLAPGDYVLVASKPAALLMRYGVGLNIAGMYEGNLSNGGDTLEIDDIDSGTIHGFTYDDAWYPSTDGPGRSLVIIDPLGPVDNWDLAPSWTASQALGGSPGESDSSTVVGRHVFYNQSRHDGASAAANASDDGAIATDKAALLPGQTATFANYTSYTRGINGIMVDIAGLPGSLSAGDFDFRVGNSNTPSAWTLLATAPNVSVRAGAGIGGSNRVTLIWTSGAIIKQWLQVTIKANAATGLAASDVFYFGNAIGEAGNALEARVTVSDEVAARNNPYSAAAMGTPAPVTNRWDYNRDGNVSALDMVASRNNQTTVVAQLRLITPPLSLSSGLATQSLADGEAREPFDHPRMAANLSSALPSTQTSQGSIIRSVEWHSSALSETSAQRAGEASDEAILSLADDSLATSARPSRPGAPDDDLLELLARGR